MLMVELFSFEINHFLRHPSVDRYVLAVHKIIFLLADEQAQTGDVFRFTYSPRRMLGVIFWAKLFVVARLDPARRNRVDRDMPLGKR